MSDDKKKKGQDLDADDSSDEDSKKEDGELSEDQDWLKSVESTLDEWKDDEDLE